MIVQLCTKIITPVMVVQLSTSHNYTIYVRAALYKH